MNETKTLLGMARRLWVASAYIDARGEVAFDVDGLDSFLAANGRSLARGRTLGWVPFAVAGSPEEASGACDELLIAMRENAASHGRRGPRTVGQKLARLMQMAARRPAPKIDEDPDEGMDEDEPEPASAGG
ncbi:MAG: hypothetical protein KBE65_11365 [Phycisphaerae bacterium]|nr:hypothetical protein [Phycisphaerae bacterium]